jgi:hypothetical protein
VKHGRHRIEEHAAFLSRERALTVPAETVAFSPGGAANADPGVVRFFD